MSNNAQVLLSDIIDQRRIEIASNYPEAEFFEIFAAEQLLKEYDLAYEEITAGIVDGGGDGGIDSMFLFLNEDLIQADIQSASSRKTPEIRLIIIQSKTETGFSESAVEKLRSSAEDLFDLGKDIETLGRVYNEDVLESFRRFRRVYRAHASRFPELHVSYFYVTKGDKPHPNVDRKVEVLKSIVTKLFSTVHFSFDFLGARELLDRFQSRPAPSLPLKLDENPILTKSQGYVCLVHLRDFNRFIVGNEGKLKRVLFEANVRDYQGKTEVNDEIQKTLENPSVEDFWWLNNGITVLAKRASLSGKELILEEPQIVNGLQTSTEIHRFFSRNPNTQESRQVLVRVIVPDDDSSRDRIIKATNSQTAIQPASLRATEQIHRDIEEYFKSRGLYYDRRKNFYKNQGKPIMLIVSISQLAQAVLAISLQEPDNARARPSSMLKDDTEHSRIFSSTYSLQFYFVCCKLMLRVDDFLNEQAPKIDAPTRNNLRYYLGMLVAAEICGTAGPTVEQISKIDVNALSASVLAGQLKLLRAAFEELGTTDQIAKGAKLIDRLKINAAQRLKVQQHTPTAVQLFLLPT